MKKKLCRIKEKGMLCGVCAGVAEYFDIDVTLVRVLWAIVTLAGGSGIIAYIICAILFPDDPGYTEVDWHDADKS